MSIPEELIERIDGRISDLMPTDGRADALFGMMRYHLGWVDEEMRPVRMDPGKRIRPRICFLVCEAAGGRVEDALPAATAVELVHNFSLIHDDIQDNSQYRRHRRTVWALWGVPQAINAGDCMLAIAQLALADGEQERRDPRRALRSVQALNVACRRLCEGQYLDLEYERRPSVTLDDYYAMIECKTGALMEASCAMGALYGAADEEAIQAYSSFGMHLGLAFQAQDDYLGIWGDPKETGKPAADDVASKKKSLPLLYALAKADGADRETLRDIMSRSGQATAEEIRTVLEILGRCDAVQYVASEVARLSDIALAALDSAHPLTGPRDELAALCRKLAIRTR